MIKLSRILGLVTVLVSASLGPAAAGSWYEYGTCYVYNDGGFYPVGYTTFSECCGAYGGYEWDGYGGPYLCERDYHP